MGDKAVSFSILTEVVIETYASTLIDRNDGSKVSNAFLTCYYGSYSFLLCTR